jgi:hypothetical protein
MTDPDDRGATRRLRRASLLVFWGGLGVAVLCSPLNILTHTKFRTDFDYWLVASVIAAVVAGLALVVYLASLVSDRSRQRRTLNAALAGGAAPDKPIIMLVVPGVAVGTGAIEKTAERFFTGQSLLRNTATTYYGLSGRPMLPPGEEDAGPTPGAGDFDPLERLPAAVDDRAPLVVINALGLTTDADESLTETREEIFRRLSAAARLILMIAAPSAQVLTDLAQLVASPALIAKTFFIMPRDEAATRWAALADHAAAKLGLALPAHARAGAVFRLTADKRVGDTVALESLESGLRNYLTGRASERDLDVEKLWKAVAIVQSSIAPRSALDFARRVSATRFVDDAETLIKLLGGTVARPEGGFLAKTTVTLRLAGETKSFARDTDMVQWIIDDLAPRLESGAVTAATGTATASP